MNVVELTSPTATAVKEYLAAKGADLVGVAPIDRFPSDGSNRDPRVHFKRVQSVVVFARRVAFSSATPYPSVAGLQFGDYTLEAQLNDLAYETSIWLEDAGDITMPMPAGRDVVSFQIHQRPPEEPRISLVGSFDLRYAAVVAGVGRLGANGLVINERFGSRIRLCAVLTTAKLKPDAAFDFGGELPDFCHDCGFRCVKACPATALAKPGHVDHYRCLAIRPDLVDPGEVLASLQRDLRGTPVLLAAKQLSYTISPPHTCATCTTLCPMDQGRKLAAIRFRAKAGKTPILQMPRPFLNERAMSEPTVIFERVGAVVRIILNRPFARNALSLALCHDLLQILQAVCVMVGSGEVRAATLQGVGSAFSAGADLKERAAMDLDAMAAHSQLIATCCDRLAQLPCPIVACVNGAALGGGFELALACDLRVIAADATLGFPESTYGFFPGAGGPVRLVRLVGISTATYLLMSTSRISGDEAVRLHIGHEVVASRAADQKGFELAQKIASFPAKGVGALRELLGNLDNEWVADKMAQARTMRDRLNEDDKVQKALATFRQRNEKAGDLRP